MPIPRALLAAALAAALAPAAAAQQVKGKLEGGVAWGRSFGGTFAHGSNAYFDREVESDTAILSGVRLAYNLDERLSFEILVEKVNTRFVETSEAGIFASQPTAGELEMRFVEGGPRWAFTRGRFVVFAGLAAGIAVLDPGIPDRPDVRDTTRFSAHLLAGVKAYAFPWLGLRVDVRPRFVSLDGGRWLREMEADSGLFLAF